MNLSKRFSRFVEKIERSIAEDKPKEESTVEGKGRNKSAKLVKGKPELSKRLKEAEAELSEKSKELEDVKSLRNILGIVKEYDHLTRDRPSDISLYYTSHDKTWKVRVPAPTHAGLEVKVGLHGSRESFGYMNLKEAIEYTDKLEAYVNEIKSAVEDTKRLDEIREKFPDLDAFRSFLESREKDKK